MVRVSSDCNLSAGSVEIHKEISELLRKLDSNGRKDTPPVAQIRHAVATAIIGAIPAHARATTRLLLNSSGPQAGLA